MVARVPANKRLLIAYLILAITVTFAFYAVWQLGQRINETNEKQDAALRSILCLARNNTLTSKQRTPDEKEEIIAFYDEAMALANLEPCAPLDTP